MNQPPSWRFGNPTILGDNPARDHHRNAFRGHRLGFLHRRQPPPRSLNRGTPTIILYSLIVLKKGYILVSIVKTLYFSEV
jgi:hypothetical protein